MRICSAFGSMAITKKSPVRHIEFCTKAYHTHIREFGVKYCFHVRNKTWRRCETLRLYVKNYVPDWHLHG